MKAYVVLSYEYIDLLPFSFYKIEKDGKEDSAFIFIVIENKQIYVPSNTADLISCEHFISCVD